MKNYKTITFLLLLISSIGIAQGGRNGEKMAQIKSLKVAYITNALSLTPDEAAKFWPVYNAFEENQKQLRKKKVASYLERIDGGTLDKISDKEANSVLAQMEDTEEELYQLRKKFGNNLKTILPAVKIIQLKKAEEGFSRKLLKQYREKGRRK